MNNEYILRAMSIVYGSPPFGWTTPERLSDISFRMCSLPRVHENVVPLTTYLLFARRSVRFDLSTQYTVIFSDKLLLSFKEQMLTMQDHARVQVSLDDGNFKAEVAAFGSLEVAITAPHLDVSPLYRYMAAIQQGMLTCVDDSLVAEAVKALRDNPYLYFCLRRWIHSVDADYMGGNMMQQKEMSVLSKELLLGGLLYFKSCREQYLQACKDTVATLIDSGEMTAYSIVERTIRLFISVDIEVKPVVIMRKLVGDMNKLPPANTTLITQYLDIIEQLDDSSKYTEQLCSNVLMEQSTVTILTSAVDELKKLRSVPEVQAQLRKTADKLAGVSGPGKLTLYNPVMAAKDVLVHRDKVPTGITFLDYLLGGGIVWGEHGGCLGPPSGGKSLLANMLLCNLAIQGHDVMLLQFEQSVKYNSDIVSRIYAYLTRLPRSEFADKSYDELSDKARQALQSCEKVSSHIRIGSFTDDTVARTVDTIIETIEDSISSGFYPKMVIIDWLGAVVSEFLASATGTDANYPILAQQIQDRLVSYGKERNVSFFFLHQSSNDAAIKPPAYRPNMHDSYFFRGFSQKLEFCLELGTKSKQPSGKFACWLHCGKVRGSEPDKSVVILLDGANAKMEATRDGEYMINSSGHFVEVSRALINDKPDDLDTDPTELDATYMAGFGR